MDRQRHPRDIRIEYEFIKAHQKEFDIAMMCRVLEVSHSGYYAWLSRPVSKRDRDNQRLVGLIRASYLASGGVYGAPRIFLDLRSRRNVQQAPRRAPHATAQDPIDARLPQTARHQRRGDSHRAQYLAARFQRRQT